MNQVDEPTWEMNHLNEERKGLTTQISTLEVKVDGA